jgi:hypothetical protein
MKALLALLSFLALATPALCASITPAYTSVTTNQSIGTGGITDIPGASISSGNFTAGEKYLIITGAHVANDSADGNINTRTTHGTTDFTESIAVHESPSAGLRRGQYAFMDLWTAVSGEGIKMRYSRGPAGTNALADQIYLISIPLAQLTDGSDYKYGENTTTTAVDTSWSGHASITFTPANAGDTWLVIGMLRMIHGGATTTSSMGRLARSGEASSSTPDGRIEHASDTTHQTMVFSRCYTLGNASNTFTIEASESASSSHSHEWSAVFALRLNAFDSWACSYTDGNTAVGTGAFGSQLQTATITPSATGDVWFGATFGFDVEAGTRLLTFRTQIDDADFPATQTSDAYTKRMARDDGDVAPYMMQGITSLSNAAHTIDLDAHADSNGGGTLFSQAVHRTIWAVSMLLASTPPAPSCNSSQFLLMGASC